MNKPSQSKAPTARQGLREDRDYDVCLSFAGEQRGYVERVAAHLQRAGVRVFYDRYEEVALWGKELYEHLDYVYGKAARYCVLFVSRDYAEKLWTNHERRSAQTRAFRENREYILPARFDDTEIPGLRTTVGYVDLNGKRARDLGAMIVQKLGPRQCDNFMPPVPDRLHAVLRVRSERGRERVEGRVHSFFQALRRMSAEERQVVLTLFSYGCDAELPENVHISSDLVRRLTGLPVTQLTQLLSGVGSLGFGVSMRSSHRDEGDIAEDGPYFVVQFDSLRDGPAAGPATREAREAVRLVRTQYCADCATRALDALDFSALSSVTASTGAHR